MNTPLIKTAFALGILAFSAFFSPSAALAQPAKPKAESVFIGSFDKAKNPDKPGKFLSMQGMTSYHKYIFSAQNFGVLTIYKIKGKGMEKVSQFHLASYSTSNHANTLSFGTEKVAASDPFPVMYIAECIQRTEDDPMKDALFVERISPDLKSSTLIQTIRLNDPDNYYGRGMQWTVDNERGFLYSYGNTIWREDPATKHRVLKFRLPSLSEGPEVVLNYSDALEDFAVEDSFDYPLHVGQGLEIHNGLLFLPTGTDKPGKPSIMYVFDLDSREMAAIVDLQECTESELEDSSFPTDRKGRRTGKNVLYMQSQKGLWKISFEKFPR